MWATNAAEKEGGAVAMDVGIGEGGGGEDDEWEEGHESDWVDAVYATTRCYYCQVYGHMARECPAKAKGKGAAKGGGKGATKGATRPALPCSLPSSRSNLHHCPPLFHSDLVLAS